MDEISAREISYIKSVILDDEKMFKELDEKYKQNGDIALVAIAKNVFNYKYIGDALKKDRNFIKMALERQPGLYKDINEEFKNDINLINVTLKMKPTLYKIMSNEIKQKIDIVLMVIKEELLIVNDVPEVLIKNKESLNKILDVALRARQYKGLSNYFNELILMEVLIKNDDYKKLLDDKYGGESNFLDMYHKKNPIEKLMNELEKEDILKSIKKTKKNSLLRKF